MCNKAAFSVHAIITGHLPVSSSQWCQHLLYAVQNCALVSVADSNGRGRWVLHALSKICRILPQKIFKKALYICEPPPPFSTFRICKYRVCFLIAFFFFCFFVYFPRERLICFIHAPSENILDAHLIIFYPIQTILQLIRSFRRKNRLVKHSSLLDEDEGDGSNFVLSAKANFHWTK